MSSMVTVGLQKVIFNHFAPFHGSQASVLASFLWIFTNFVPTPPQLYCRQRVPLLGSLLSRLEILRNAATLCKHLQVVPMCPCILQVVGKILEALINEAMLNFTNIFCRWSAMGSSVPIIRGFCRKTAVALKRDRLFGPKLAPHVWLYF